MIICNDEGLDLDTDDSPPQNSDKICKDDQNNKSETPTIQDVQNAIKKMTSLIPNYIQPSDEETEAFKSRLEPIIDRMETLSFH